MQKITPHLWFDTQAKEAAAFYTSIFPNSRNDASAQLHDTPSGTVDIVTIQLAGQEFTLLSAGPYFKFTPAISFLVGCSTVEEVDTLWAALIQGGTALMEIGEAPYSKRYGWVQDKFGVSWQLMHMGERPITQKITPQLMFVGDVCGKAEEAMNLYTSVFQEAKITGIARYGADAAPDKEGTVLHAAFTLENQEFFAMDSAHKHDFTFNEAVSFIVNCTTQEEVDYYWDKLSAVPAAEQCGWIKDKFGISWQIIPIGMNELFKQKDPEKLARVTKAMLAMKKLDLAALQRAADEPTA